MPSRLGCSFPFHPRSELRPGVFRLHCSIPLALSARFPALSFLDVSMYLQHSHAAPTIWSPLLCFSLFLSLFSSLFASIAERYRPLSRHKDPGLMGRQQRALGSPDSLSASMQNFVMPRVFSCILHTAPTLNRGWLASKLLALILTLLTRRAQSSSMFAWAAEMTSKAFEPLADRRLRMRDPSGKGGKQELGANRDDPE